jgi:hypothetical protein
MRIAKDLPFSRPGCAAQSAGLFARGCGLSRISMARYVQEFVKQ